MRLAAAAAALLYIGVARAEVGQERAGAAGYVRVMTRPDFQGGDSRLGFWNLYGRLLNEGPYAALELRLALVPEAATSQVWTSVHAKIEGGSVLNADAGRGALGLYNLSQLYVQAGNILLEHVTWQLGTLYSYVGDLGLYDLRPSEIFFDTIGLSGRYRHGRVDVLLGVGDAGYAIKATRPANLPASLAGLEEPAYNTVFSGGGFLRLHLSEHFELGAGAQLYYEPKVRGNPAAPHRTPLPRAIGYRAYERGRLDVEYAQSYPGEELPEPVAVSASSWKLVGYLGFGGFGPLRWSALHASLAHLHPWNASVTGTTIADEIYVHDFTDERYRLLAGNEMQLTLVPGVLDAAWAVLYGRDDDLDNDLFAGEDNRSYASTVLRLQTYLSETVHLLVESSVARELSKNGNLWREHFDSIFTSQDGVGNTDGLEFGDTDRRFTWQGKAGVVLNPAGTGIYTRPSIRLLYGLQYSNVHDAFMTSFSKSLGDETLFPQSRDRHWHSVIALEAEAWF